MSSVPWIRSVLGWSTATPNNDIRWNVALLHLDCQDMMIILWIDRTHYAVVMICLVWLVECSHVDCFPWMGGCRLGASTSSRLISNSACG